MKKQAELISVILPTNDTEKHLIQRFISCLISIKNQTYENFEVLMIDCGLTEEVSEICKIFEKEDNRFKYFYKENIDIVHSKNYGLSLKSGNYVSFINAYDILFPEYLEKLLKAIQGNDLSICGYYKIDYNSQKDKSNKTALNRMLFDNRLNFSVDTELKEQLELKGFDYKELDVELFSQEIILYDSVNYENQICDDKTKIVDFILENSNTLLNVLRNKLFRSSKIEFIFDNNLKVGHEANFVIEYLRNCKSMSVIHDKLYLYNYNRVLKTSHNVILGKFKTDRDIYIKTINLLHHLTQESFETENSNNHVSDFYLKTNRKEDFSVYFRLVHEDVFSKFNCKKINKEFIENVMILILHANDLYGKNSVYPDNKQLTCFYNSVLKSGIWKILMKNKLELWKVEKLFIFLLKHNCYKSIKLLFRHIENCKRNKPDKYGKMYAEVFSLTESI